MVMSLLFACSAKNITPQRGGVSMSRVSGPSLYLQRMALPPSSLITVQLVDVSRADSPAIVIGEQFFEAGGQQVPFVFEYLRSCGDQGEPQLRIEGAYRDPRKVAFHQRSALRRRYA